MKGVILTRGTGSRLYPLIRVTNKHLLPICDKPMIFYPIQTLVNAGIEDIMVVTGGHNSGDFLRLLGNGKDFGLKHINYTYQEGEGGLRTRYALGAPQGLVPGKANDQDKNQDTNKTKNKNRTKKGTFLRSFDSAARKGPKRDASSY